MRLSMRLLALVLAVSLVLGLFCFTASCAGPSDLEAKVGEMLAATDYAGRRAAYTEADTIYQGLTAEEKSEVSELYARMEGVREELAQMDAEANDFATMVAAIPDIAIGDRMTAINRAEEFALEELDGSHPVVAAAKLRLDEMKSDLQATIDKCLAFMAAVSDAEQTSEEDYLELREALDLAAEYVDEIDRSYPGVSGAYHSYSSMMSELYIKERYTAGVLAKVNEMISADTYAARKMLREEIDNLLISENYIPDYEGMAAALAEMALAEEEMKQSVIKATRFILAVEAVATAENYREALIGCYAFLEGVDLTVDGAGSAKASFDGMVNAYNSSVNYCNSFMSGR